MNVAGNNLVSGCLPTGARAGSAAECAPRPLWIFRTCRSAACLLPPARVAARLRAFLLSDFDSPWSKVHDGREAVLKGIDKWSGLLHRVGAAQGSPGLIFFSPP